MKFIIKTVLICLLSWGMQQFVPFWGVAIAGFFVSMLVKTKAHTTFFSGFVAVFLLWFAAAYRIDQQTNSILTQRIADLFSLSPWLLMLITALLGGIIGGLGSLSGHYFQALFGKKKNIYHT